MSIVERSQEFVEQVAQAGITMGLENRHDTPAKRCSRRLQSRPHFLRMMRIIVQD